MDSQKPLANEDLSLNLLVVVVAAATTMGGVKRVYLSKTRPTRPSPQARPSPTGFGLPTNLNGQGLGRDLTAR
jgi:hypothetical protein